MSKNIIVVTIALMIISFLLDLFAHDLLEKFVTRFTPFITCLAIIGAIGLVFSFLASFHQENESRKSRISNLITETAVNINVCSNEFLVKHKKNKELEDLPVPESRFHIKIIESALSLGDITNKDLNYDLWNCYRLMSLVNSLLNQARDIRHTEHIADPDDNKLIAGRRFKVNKLVKDTIPYIKEIKEKLESIKTKLAELK